MAWQPKGNIKGPIGPAGPQGLQGVQGAPGTAGAQGPQGATGAQGVAGPQGAQGPTGATGQAEKWYNGAGPPAAGLGVLGDLYLDNTSAGVYEKLSGGWSFIANIKGPTGNTGATGSQGPQGAQGIQGPIGPAGPTGPMGGAVILYGPTLEASVAGIAGATGLGKMCGFAAYFTPTRTGLVLIQITGNFFCSTALGVVWASGYYGAGTAPTLGEAAGTSGYIGGIGTVNNSFQSDTAGKGTPCSFFGMVPNLVLGTRYWVDVNLTNTGAVGNVGFNYPCVAVMEL
jgi:hypothetical protein